MMPSLVASRAEDDAVAAGAKGRGDTNSESPSGADHKTGEVRRGS
jgi:hypothetical protein